jgi:hypothetical protein
MRDTDRKKISEAVRLQKLWRYETDGAAYPSGTYVEYVTDFDERLRIEYGETDRVRCALYTHWDRDTGDVVSNEHITTKKRERVLHLINQGRDR